MKLQQFLEGSCVRHEVDVLAENEENFLMIECKYHNRQAVNTNVKVPLYIHSRFTDVLSNWNKTLMKKKLEGWLVTNTRFSEDAIKYGACVGLHLLGWDYPKQNSLSNLVDRSALYPISCLTTLTNKEKAHLLETNIVLCRDLINKQELLQKIPVSSIRIPGILSEVETLSGI